MSKDQLPQTGEGLHGERLSPLPNVPEDFPSQSVDLGETAPSSAAEIVDLRETLPAEVGHEELARLGDNTNSGPPRGRRP